MDILNGIKNFLVIINDNWTLILVVIGVCISLYMKIKAYFELSTQEKIEIAKTQIREIILEKVTNAEVEWDNWSRAGKIKRSEVINQIYKEYPILSKVAEQEKLVKWLDDLIDNALVTMRDVIDENNDTGE